MSIFKETLSYFSGSEPLCKIAWKWNKNCGRSSNDRH